MEQSRRWFAVLALVPLLAIALVACSDADGSDDAANEQVAESAGACPDGTSGHDGLCVASGDDAAQAAALVRETFDDARLGSITVEVWRDGDPVVVGSLGDSLPGIPATTGMYHPIGNISATFLTTVFLQLVDEDILAVDDTLDAWFPELPESAQITLGDLARSMTGYAHHPATDGFLERFTADPFAPWDPEDLVAYGTADGTAFPPGTGWQFSDTNLLLLGLVIEAETGESVHTLVEERILGPEHLESTFTRSTAVVPSPVLHGFTDERGVWEESTFWTPTWVPFAGDMVSNQADIVRWIEIVADGTLLSEEAHAEQLAPATVGLAGNTADRYYAMGLGVTNGWIFMNPGLQGYRIHAARHAAEDVTILIVTTFSPASDQDARVDAPLFQSLGELLAPGNAPALSG